MLPQQPLITGRRHMVVAGHYLATEAGLKILEAGGNAVDAGVAAGIALGVLHSDQVQFSGVAPMLIYIKKLNKVIAIEKNREINQTGSVVDSCLNVIATYDRPIQKIIGKI